MSHHPRPRGADWLAAILMGAALGAPILGVGSRYGMRAIAIARDQVPSFTLDGSLAVVFMGVVTGAVVGALFALGRTLAPHSRFGRNAIFWSLTTALVWRGINPVDVLQLVWFAPLFLIHGGLLTLYWCRVRIRGTANLRPTANGPRLTANR